MIRILLFRPVLLLLPAILGSCYTPPDARHPAAPALRERMQQPVSLLVVRGGGYDEMRVPVPAPPPPKPKRNAGQKVTHAMATTAAVLVVAGFGLGGGGLGETLMGRNPPPPRHFGPPRQWSTAVSRELCLQWASRGSPFASAVIADPPKGLRSAIPPREERAKLPGRTMLILSAWGYPESEVNYQGGRGGWKLYFQWRVLDTLSGSVLARGFFNESSKRKLTLSEWMAMPSSRLAQEQAQLISSVVAQLVTHYR